MRIVVAAVGTRGDVEPHLALCLGLQSAGYQVTLVAPIDFEQQAANAKLAFHAIQVSFRELYDTPAAAALLASGKSIKFLVKLGQIAVPIAQQIVSDIFAACQDADAVCFSPMAFPAYYAAQERGIPAFPTGLQPLGRTRAHAAPLFPWGPRTPRFVNRLSYLVMEQVFWQFFRPLMNVRLKATRNTTAPFFGHFSDTCQNGNPMLFAYSPSVVPRPADWTASMHVTGYWHLPPRAAWTPPAHVSEFLANGSPPVCVGFGSMHDPRIDKILDVTLDALSGMGARAIVLTGWSGLPQHTIASRSAVCVAESIPHSWLFPRVAAVVSHGGAGTTAAALRAGVPSMVVPFFFDQAFWGRWLHRKGLGPDPISHRNFSRGAIVKALEHATGCERVRSNLHSLSQELLAEDGVGNAVSIIGQALRRQTQHELS